MTRIRVKLWACLGASDDRSHPAEVCFVFMFNFVAWNCRGDALNRSKQDLVKSLIRKYQLSMFVLFETNVEAVNSGVRWCTLKVVFDDLSLHRVCVYDYPVYVERNRLWSEISPITCEFDCVIVCRVNDILHCFERWNVSGSHPTSMVRFREFIGGCSLFDLPLQGRGYTWSNIAIAETTLSDHFPIIFKSDGVNRSGCVTFRSLICWWDNEKFLPFLKRKWRLILRRHSDKDFDFTFRYLEA